MKKLLLVCASAALISCAGAADSKDAVISLVGSEWGTNIEGQYIQFMEGGKTSGNGGCNRFGGPYIQDGDSLKIGPLISTEMACLNLTDETLFFQILGNTRSVDATHLQLVLKDENGKILLTLKRRDWD